MQQPAICDLHHRCVLCHGNDVMAASRHAIFIYLVVSVMGYFCKSPLLLTPASLITGSIVLSLLLSTVSAEEVPNNVSMVPPATSWCICPRTTDKFWSLVKLQWKLLGCEMFLWIHLSCSYMMINPMESLLLTTTLQTTLAQGTDWWTSFNSPSNKWNKE